MAWSKGGRSSWARFRRTSMAGSSSPASCVRGRKRARNAAVASSIRGWHDALRPARCKTWRNTRPSSASSPGSATASRTRTKGPEVWEIKWEVFWRKKEDGLPGRRHCLIVARNVITQEVKYFLANRVPGERGVTLRWLLRVAFGRWVVERCFRVAKDALGMDHYQVRGWRCLHRHFYLTQLTYLFCARMRQEYDKPGSEATERLTIEAGPQCDEHMAHGRRPEARRASSTAREERKEERYYQRRNKRARKSHTQTKIARFAVLGIDVDHIKSCKT